MSCDCHIPKFKKIGIDQDFLYDRSLKKLQKKVIYYSKKHPIYPKEEPKGDFVFRKKYGAVQEKYTGDVLGWIIKL